MSGVKSVEGGHCSPPTDIEEQLALAFWREVPIGTGTWYLGFMLKALRGGDEVTSETLSFIADHFPHLAESDVFKELSGRGE